MSRQTAIQTTNSNEIHLNAPSAPVNGVSGEQPTQTWSYVPAMDVIEWQHEYTITFDAPGIAPDRIDLTYDNGVIQLHGHVPPRHAEGVKFLRQEYGVGDFDRSIPLGRLAEFVDGERISATYELGVLTVHLPKFVEAQGKRIKIKAK